jgi:hypothetical protein
MTKKYKLILATLFGSSFISNAQLSSKTSYVFSQDSIKGFDEVNAKAIALNSAFYGEEYKYFMYNEKRNFINKKYNIKPQPEINIIKAPSSAVFLTHGISQKASSILVSSGSCQNEDFEDAQSNPGPQMGGVVNGWTLSGGTGANYCAPSASLATSIFTVYNSPVVDP